MLDGQILFDDCRGGVPEWHIDETLTRLIQAGTIDRGGHRSPPAHARVSALQRPVFSPASLEPAGRQFPDFLASDAVPFVAGRYRIEKGPQAIGGSSYGGIAALYALLQRPDLFTLGLLESPSLAVGNGQLLRDTEHLFKGPARVYLGMGGRESGRSADSAGNLAYVEMVRTLERNLKAIAANPPEVLTVIQTDAKTPALSVGNSV